MYSPALGVTTFILLGILYLASCWIPREWQRILVTEQTIIESLQQGTTSLADGRFSIAEATLQFTNDTNPPQQRAQLVIPLWDHFSPFDQFVLEGQLQGPGDILIRFDQQHQYSVQSLRDATTGTFLLRGDVIQDTSPQLVILGPDPEHESSPIVRLPHLQLRGVGYRSYGNRLIRWFLLSFVWVLLILSPLDKKWIMAMLGMIMLSYAIIRLSYVLNIAETPFSDMADYENIALGLLKGNERGHNPFFQSFYAHGLPYYVGAIYFLFGLKNMLALKLANVVLGLITTVVLYACGRRVSGARAGLIAAFLFAFSHEMTFWSAKLSTEHLFACISILGLYCVLQAWQGNKAFWFFLAGMMLGYLFFIRSVLHFFLLFLFLGFLLLHPSPWRKRLSHGLIFIIGFLLVLSPWIFRGYQRYDELMLTGTGGWFSFVHQNNDIVQPGEFGGRAIQDYYQSEAPQRFENDLAASKWAGEEARAWVLSHPGRYLRLSIGRFRLLFIKNGIALTKVSPLELNFLSHSYYYLFHWNAKKYVAVAWLALVAFFILLWRLPFHWQAKRVKTLFYQYLPLIFLIGMSFLYLLSLSFPRYRDPLLPLLYLIIGMGADPALQWVRSKWILNK